MLSVVKCEILLSMHVALLCENIVYFFDICVLQKMPEKLTYDVCYLNKNAGIILSQKNSVQLLDTIKLMQGSSVKVADTYYDVVYNVTVDILDKVLMDVMYYKVLQQ